jgi:uncharacterized protein YbbK (DUF523 family)
LLPISIGLSRCLLGDAVRYDGKGKYSETCSDLFNKTFSLYLICPEVEAGFSIPRPAIELVQHTSGIKIIGRYDKQLDVTEQLNNYCDNKVLSLGFLSGYIFTPRSPSCGFASTPIKSIDGETLFHDSGVFTQALLTKYPTLPVIEEPKLSSFLAMLRFQLQVISYYLIHHVNAPKPSADLVKGNVTLDLIFQNEMSMENKMSAVNELFLKMNAKQLHVQLMKLKAGLNDK